MPVLLGAIAIVAVAGFVVRMPRVLRALLILPSAMTWTLLGLFALWAAWTGQDFVPPRPSMVLVSLWGLVATAAGISSIESILARLGNGKATHLASRIDPLERQPRDERGSPG
jgi:hypothetical protein